MRISELAERTGVSIPTLKYYLREGLLHAGEAQGATRASYDESHVERVRLVRTLVDVGRLSIDRVREVVRCPRRAAGKPARAPRGSPRGAAPPRRPGAAGDADAGGASTGCAPSGHPGASTRRPASSSPRRSRPPPPPGGASTTRRSTTWQRAMLSVAETDVAPVSRLGPAGGGPALRDRRHRPDRPGAARTAPRGAGVGECPTTRTGPPASRGACDEPRALASHQVHRGPETREGAARVTTASTDRRRRTRIRRPGRLALARRLPFTLAVVGTMLVARRWRPARCGTRWRTGTCVHHVAYGLPALQDGRWWTPVTGAFFALTPAQYLPVAGGALLMVGWSEWRLGHPSGRRRRHHHPPGRRPARLALPARRRRHRMGVGRPARRGARRRVQRRRPRRGRCGERHPDPAVAWAPASRPVALRGRRPALRRSSLGPRARHRHLGRARPRAGPARPPAVARAASLQPTRVAGRVVDLLRRQRARPDPALLHAVRRAARRDVRRHGRVRRPHQRGDLAPARRRSAARVASGVVPRGRARDPLPPGPVPAHRRRGRGPRAAQRRRSGRDLHPGARRQRAHHAAAARRPRARAVGLPGPVTPQAARPAGDRGRRP